MNFVFAGRQTQSKGFFDFLRAAADLASGVQRSSFRLLLAGDVPDHEVGRRELALKDLADIVEDFGRISNRGELLELLSRADVLVLPSYREGLPLVLLEAMAVGCIPIASNVGGIPEVVSHEDNGILVSPGNIDELRSAMAKAIDNREMLAGMSERARKRVEQDYLFDSTVASYLTMYAER